MFEVVHYIAIDKNLEKNKMFHKKSQAINNSKEDLLNVLYIVYS